jgi:hypothetical protein
MPEQEDQQFNPQNDHSETFGNVPHPAESFRMLRHHSERKESHTMTVREAARVFEAAGVARTERSIVNWCQANKMGVARLDCYFDPNEGKYFITPQSVQLAISEELAKASQGHISHAPAETSGKLPIREQPPLDQKQKAATAEVEQDEIKLLKQEVLDLKITNKGKDLIIDHFQKEREGFNAERQAYVEKLMSFNRQVGELETKLLQLQQPSQRRLEVRSLRPTSDEEPGANV